MQITNKRAHFDYFLYDRFEAGISLLGGEVKEIRKNNIHLEQAYVKIIGNELYLINASIPIEGKKDYSQTRMRKLLMNRSEITSIISKIRAKKLTIIPVKVYNKGPLIKLEIALAKIKRKFEKKESLKKADLEREVEVQLKDRQR